MHKEAGQLTNGGGSTVPSFVSSYVGAIVRPRRTFEELAEGGALRLAAGAVLSSALVYSAFELWMYLEGNAPWFDSNPIPAGQFYLWQAAFLPGLLLAWAGCASVTHGLSRALGSRRTWRATAAPLGFALAIPLTWGYVVPGLIVFGLFGYNALIAALLLTYPLTGVWWFAWLWFAIGATHRQHSVLERGVLVLVTLTVFLGLMDLLVR